VELLSMQFWLAGLFYLSRTSAFPAYIALNPNGNSVPNITAIGHVNPLGGGARNSYGLAFGVNNDGYNPTLCALDSDGDGQTNGFELGDSCCLWLNVSYNFLLETNCISHPGDASSVSARPACGCSASGALPLCNCCGGHQDNSNCNAPPPTPIPPTPGAAPPPLFSTSLLLLAGIAVAGATAFALGRVHLQRQRTMERVDSQAEYRVKLLGAGLE